MLSPVSPRPAGEEGPEEVLAPEKVLETSVKCFFGLREPRSQQVVVQASYEPRGKPEVGEAC